jgi:hypothetical protein
MSSPFFLAGLPLHSPLRGARSGYTFATRRASRSYLENTKKGRPSIQAFMR